MGGTCHAFVFLSLLTIAVTSHPASREVSLDNPRALDDTISPPDTMVNYCKLIQAAFFYGQKFADKKLGLTEDDVIWYNTLWESVFNLPFYQVGITTREFIMGARFGEGSHAPFPPSSQYSDKYPDTYFMFHLVKEMGMIHSQYFSRCPSCVEHSLAKINAYLKVTQLRQRIPQLWSEGNMHKRLTTPHEADSVLVFIKCLFPDRLLDPKGGISALDSAVQCQDTFAVRSVEEIHPKLPGQFQYCDLPASVDTNGPELIRGKANKRRSIYTLTFVAYNPCQGPDTCKHYFVISR